MQETTPSTKTNITPTAKRTLSIRPKTYYVELAEMGALYDFIRHNMASEFQNDTQFRNHILSVIIDHSDTIVPEVEETLLGDLSKSLQEFLERATQCQTQP